MKLLPERDEGWDAMYAVKENVVTSINASMQVLPLCCSTGVLNSVTATNLMAHDEGRFKEQVELSPSLTKTINIESYMHLIVDALVISRIAYPIEVAAWYSLSKILMKVVEGKDDSNVGGYNNYKAAQILMADRICEDKRDKKFKFDSYNIVFSCDQLMDWLKEREDKLGDIQISDPRPGGHGARVRACIITPNIPKMQRYHDEKLALLKQHVFDYVKAAPSTEKTEVIEDKVAAQW